ncbi:hypothetical protein MRP26_21835 [Bacillus sp. CCB-MMP212]|uniref:hypothetical protein n=1 Tax=Bacillus TaxID=1386 RepID=UPI001443C301|nr:MULTISPECIES: hypothetical protein [Bacillus]MCI4251564.1 hypothetical protein [Bacillus sp. CCB-MMP212]MDA1913630.1 hypothetical protein [Bacillus cereus]MDA2659750.1 hypothetical protein [Bacillus cereus]NKX61474.1 hypothetical protein [Bacillus cereus]
MNNYFIKIKKIPTEENETLSFRVFERVDEVIGGAHYSNKTIEQNEQLRFYESSAVGTISGFVDTRETETSVSYQIYNEYSVGTLTRIANEIIEETSNYQEQFERFIEQMEHRMVVNKIFV